MDETRAPFRGGGRGSIWRVVIGTILFTGLSGLIWHETAMLKIHRLEAKSIRMANHEIQELTKYHEALARGGISEATHYLLASSTKFYDF